MNLWADNEAKQDLIGFQYLADAVISVIKSDSLLPATIGVFGDWGSGKSTLLRMVANRLQADSDTLVLEFNGWLFEGYDDAKTALMETIIDQITKRQNLTPKAKKLALKLIRRVNWFRLAGKGIKYTAAFAAGGPVGVGLVAGLDAVKLAEKAADQLENVTDEQATELLKNESSGTLLRGIKEFREQFSELLRDSSIKRLVVIIDDLDRCLPSTIIETLEAIKLFLFVERSAFILGADERLVKYAVRQRFPELPGDNAEVGRDYLEKLIQFPIRVPPLARDEMTNYVCHLFASGSNAAEDKLGDLQQRVIVRNAAQLGQSVDFVQIVQQIGGFPSQLINELALAQRIGPILGIGLNGNPRQCKRFLNTLVMRLAMAQSRSITAEPRVLAKLMLLEYFKPASFRRLAVVQAEEAGKPKQLALLERSVANEKSKNRGKSAGSVKKKTKVEASDDTNDGAEDIAETKEDEVSGEFAAWLDDPWIKDWLSGEPVLTDIDLRPYFYFSRDSLSALASTAQRLTPKAQEILEQLLQTSDAVRKIALKAASELSNADAAAVFDELASRTRREDNLSPERSTLPRLLEWVEARRELAGQLIITLGQLPDTLLPISVVPALHRIASGTPAEASALRLLAEWRDKAGNSMLKQAASRQLSRQPAGTR